jgi:RNA-directed DNA polymerase
MKRTGNLYTQICSMDNLVLADTKASKGKAAQVEVIRHAAKRQSNIEALRDMLADKTYKTSEYHIFKIYEPKEREIFKLPYFPDRITHHAVMNVLEPIFVATFTADTYSCIKGRGIHGADKALKGALEDREGTKYCLKLDIKKFYPNIDHEVLKQLLRRKFKDSDLLWLLDEIVDSAPGLPIGNYLSQYLANFYLTYFDHWMKETKGVRYYFRYADDIVVLAESKPYLHVLLAEIRQYLGEQLKLTVKENYQVFPVADRGIDFVGYRYFHTHTLLRKTIKQRCAKMIARKNDPASVASYNGWMSHCNSRHLRKKLNMKNFKDLKITKATNPGFTGDKIKMDRILNRQIVVHAYKIENSKFEGKGQCLHLQVEVDKVKRVVFVSGVSLMNDLRQMTSDDFPFETTIIKEDGRYQFT